MECVEILRISLAGVETNLQQQLISCIREIRGQGGLKAIRIYRNASNEYEMSVHLYWDSGSLKFEGSDLGRTLIHIFKDYGLTNHSVWKEEAYPSFAMVRPSGSVQPE